ncbi:MAG: hypothetical protein ACYTGZ_16675 [Planctomycetota bacterium]
MDRKTKKSIQQLSQKIHKMEQQLKGAKADEDEPGEVERLERELAAARKKLHDLKNG